MAKIFLNGPLTYRTKGYVFERGVVKTVPDDLAATLIATGKFLYEGQEDPVVEAEKKNKKNRTVKMSDLVNVKKPKQETKEVQVEQEGKPVKKLKTTLIKKSKKTADIDNGLPVFKTKKKLAEYALEEHDILLSDGSLEEMYEQLKTTLAEERELVVKKKAADEASAVEV